MEDIPEDNNHNDLKTNSLFSIVSNYTNYKVKYYDAYPVNTKVFCNNC